MAKRLRPRYRILPLVVLGLLIFFAVNAIGTLLYGTIAYLFSLNVQTSMVGPAIVYLVSVLAVTGTITTIIRGKSSMPSLGAVACFVIINSIISIIANGFAHFNWAGFFIKLIVGLIIAGLGFYLLKRIFPEDPRPARTNRDASGSNTSTDELALRRLNRNRSRRK